MEQLGGHATFLGAHELQLTRGETLDDTAQILSRYVDGIAARFARPRRPHRLHGRRLRSGLQRPDRALPPDRGPERPADAARAVRRPQGAEARLPRRRQQRLPLPDAEWRGRRHARRRRLAGSLRAGPRWSSARGSSRRSPAGRSLSPTIRSRPSPAPTPSTPMSTRAWASRTTQRSAGAGAVQGDSALMAAGAHRRRSSCTACRCSRDEEVEAAVADGPQSIVFEQAANRLHMHKALLLLTLG